MKSEDKFYLCLAPVVIAGLVGWIMNAVSIWNIATSNGELNTMFIARCIGVLVAPLGAVLGYC